MKPRTAILVLLALFVGCPKEGSQDDDTTTETDDDSQSDDDTADAADQDRDGWTVEDGDCDDTNPDVYPGAEETCDGGDSDCDGFIDEGCQECDLEVPEEHDLIQGAIDLAVDGVTICVAPGTYSETIDFGGKAVHLLGIEGAAETIIDANLEGGVVRFSNAEGPDTVVEGFTLTNGYSMFGGAGVYMEDSSPTLVGLEITGNHTDGYGGGLHLNGGEPSLTDVTITGNTALRGGGAYLWGSGSPRLSNVTVMGNQADEGGGVYFHLECDEVDLSSTVISENTALLDGGGVYFEGGAIPGLADVLGATISANHAEGSGGGAYGDGVAVGLIAPVVTSNSAGSYGGGMAIVDAGSCDVSGAYIVGNAAWDGGGLYISGGTPSIGSSVIIDNTAIANGGGIYQDRGFPIILEDLLVGSNQAGAFGGGVYTYNSGAEWRSLSVTNNTAFNGGGIYNPDTPGTFNGLIVSGNHATNDGGGGWGAPHFVNSVIVGNTATHRGGGIFGSEFQMVLANVAVLGNRSDEGGGIHIYGGSEIWSHVVVAGNEAASEGGGVYWGEEVGYIYDLTAVAIIGNTTSAGEGGGLFVSDTPPNLAHSNVFANTPTDYYGFADPTGTNGNVSVDPDFLDITAADPLDWNLHLNLMSPLIDAGDPSGMDPDGSRSDIGVYGGSGASSWDLDWDGYYEWWLPGFYDPATSPGMDCDDRDAGVWPGNGC